MTTPPRLLLEHLIPNSSMELRKITGELQRVVPWNTILRLIEAQRAEGVGPRSGRIRYLRRLDDGPMDLDSLRWERVQSKNGLEPSGSILSAASKEIFREKLRDREGGVFAWVWTHKANRHLSLAQAR